MGETISTLVFRPPPPTHIKANKYFYIRIPNVENHREEFTCADATCGGMAPPEMFSDESSREENVKNNNESTKKSYYNNVNDEYEYNKSNHNEKDPCTIMEKDEASFISSLSIGTTDEFKIPAFFLRRKGAKITILFSHGNAEDLGMMYRRMKEMAMLLCANVLAYDYTGYGLSTPENVTPSEQLCYRNIDAAYNHLTKTMKIPPSEIVLYGRSLGSGPSCYLAKRTADEGQSVAGLILHSPFLSIYRIVVDCRINLVGDMFINKSRAKDVRCPVLIIHGTKDDVVPFWHGDELLRSFPNECRAQPYWVEGLGHNHIEVKRKEEYIKRIISFLEKYVLTQLSRKSNNFVGVPKREQYKPETTLKESGKFVVNQTWMKHGLAIVNEAINEKKQNSPNVNAQKADRKAKVVSQSKPSLGSDFNSQQQQQRPSFETRKFTTQTTSTSINLSRMNTNELVQKTKEFEIIRNKRPLKDSDSCQASLCGSVKSMKSVESASSRFLLTKESWGTDDEEEDISFDEDKENDENRVNSDMAVSLQTFSVGNLSGFSLESSFIKDACELSLRKDDEDDEDAKSADLDESIDRYSIENVRVNNF